MEVADTPPVFTPPWPFGVKSQLLSIINYWLKLLSLNLLTQKWHNDPYGPCGKDLVQEQTLKSVVI